MSEENQTKRSIWGRNDISARSVLDFVGFKMTLVVLPALLFFLTGARSVEPINGQDGYAYIGVVARTQDFLSRFPDSYFGVRFGYVIPSDLFVWMFGFELGHHLLRFGLLAGVALLFTMNNRIGHVYVIAAVALFSISPIQLVSTFSTYTMSIGALSLLAGVLVLCTYACDERHRLKASIVGSALLAVGWNTHLQLLIPSIAVFGVLLLEQAADRGKPRARPFLTEGLAGVIGGLITCLAGVSILGIRYGVWNPWAPAFSFASGDASAGFRSSGFGWITWRHYVLLIPLTLTISTVAWLTESDIIVRRILRRMFLSCVALTVVYSTYQWVMGSIMFETYFHSSGLFMVCLATLSLSTVVILKRAKFGSLFAGALVPVSLGVFFFANHLEMSFGPILFLVATTCIGLLLLTILRRPIPRTLILATVIMGSWVTVSSPHDFPATPGGYRTDPLYDDALFSYDSTSMNRAIVLNRLSQMVPSLPADEGDIRVWFNPSSPIDQLSAPWLWYRSALHAPGDNPLPYVSETVRQTATTLRPRFVVIVDGEAQTVNEGARALENLAGYQLQWMRKLQEGEFVAYVALAEAR